jgi:hypothetical protein
MSIVRIERGDKASRAEMVRREADEPRSQLVRFGKDKPLKLDAGVELSPYQVAYQTYGELNADRSNAILICHALTGDQHVHNVHPVTGKDGCGIRSSAPACRSTPTASSSFVRTCSAAAWARPAPRRKTKQPAKPMV